MSKLERRNLKLNEKILTELLESKELNSVKGGLCTSTVPTNFSIKYPRGNPDGTFSLERPIPTVDDPLG
ncbi:MAG: hypothetical protein GY765_40170 [bacterium]|nr:hypothetical protein [bacterium]